MKEEELAFLLKEFLVFYYKDKVESAKVIKSNVTNGHSTWDEINILFSMNDQSFAIRVKDITQ